MSTLRPVDIDGNLIVLAAGRVAKSGHFPNRKGYSVAVQALGNVARAGERGFVVTVANRSRIADTLHDLYGYGYLARERELSESPAIYIYRLTPLGAHCHLLLSIEPMEGKTPLQTVYALRDSQIQEGAVKA